MPMIYEYTNYRKVIEDFYTEKKVKKPSYSYQCFAAKAGFKSKSSLANITSGRQSLSTSRIYEVAQAMGLGKRETEYFDALVRFNEAKTVQEKEFHFERMRSLARKTSAAKLMDSQYDYYSTWYHCVIRELATTKEFGDDFSLLAAAVDPPITAMQAKNSVKLLCKLGMLKKSPAGRYYQTEAMLSTGDEVESFALQKYHREHLRLAAESIDRHPRYLRDISSVTAGLSLQGLRQVKFEIQQFRKRLLDVIAADTPAESVYQIAFQLYPLSRLPKPWGRHDA
jgi:uncharacterized protein (TIGR02147 family)